MVLWLGRSISAYMQSALYFRLFQCIIARNSSPAALRFYVHTHTHTHTHFLSQAKWARRNILVLKHTFACLKAGLHGRMCEKELERNGNRSVDCNFVLAPKIKLSKKTFKNSSFYIPRICDKNQTKEQCACDSNGLTGKLQ